MVRIVRTTLCALLLVAALVVAAPEAQAAPPTVPWSGHASGDVAAVDLGLLNGLTLSGARLANSESTASSMTNPRASSVSRNLVAAVAGLGIAPQTNDQTAPPDNGAPETGTLLGGNAQGIGIGVLSFSNKAHCAGDGNCVPGVLADTTTGTAGLAVTPAGVAAS